MFSIAAVVCVVYLVLVTVIGSLLARRASSSAGWAVASGNMGIWMIAAGVAGTRIGGVGTYGVAGDVMDSGLWNLWYAVNTFLALALVGLFFAVPFRRLELRTVSEIFTQRFGRRRSQVLTSLCVQTEYFIVNVLEPFVIGSILSTLVGIPFGVAVFIGAAVLITYTALGGLWGSAVTNLIHCAVVVFGLLAIVVIGVGSFGGWGAVQQAVEASLAAAEPTRDPARWWSFVGAGWGAVLAMFFSATIHTPAASVYVNFSSAAKSERILPRSFLIAGLVAAVMPLLAGIVGMLTLARYGAGAGLSSYRAITQFAIDLSPLVGGIAVAAILAAVISSGGPILLAGATLFVRDWVPGSDALEPRAQLRLYRITTIVYGLVAALVAWQAEITSILDLLLLGFAMVVPPAVAMSFLLFWRRTTERACFWGIGLGYGISLLWWGAIQWCSRIGLEVDSASGALERVAHALFVGARGEGIDPSYPATLVPLVAVPLISLLAPERASSEASGELEQRRDDFYRRLARPVRHAKG
ncbi:MAG: sodium:solute symporter family protein [Acidobacteria bacterium]|nr:MAG: sodium:solute symporter family protein [Acidobacteriota bacterium]REK06893.1 MAG: sodium:solute symporter family protein [Acidobacteriota bacterium]